jgi:hypothetical protein
MVRLAPAAAITAGPDISWATAILEDGSLLVWRRGVAATWYPDAVPAYARLVAATRVTGQVRVVWADDEALVTRGHTEGDRGFETTRLLPNGPVRAVAFTPSGNMVVAALGDGTIRGFAIHSRFTWTLTTDHRPSEIRAIAAADDHVVAAFADGRIQRHDVRDGTAQTVAQLAPADAVAISRDGSVVLAATADGLLCWRERPHVGSNPTSVRPLPERVTALAVDATGSAAIACPADSGDAMWLLDLATRDLAMSRIDLADNVITSLAFAPAPADETPSKVVDDDVQFTVYRPRMVPPAVWTPMVVFAHKTDPIQTPGRAPVDPVKQVERRAQLHVADPARPVSADARAGLARGAGIAIIPDLPGMLCNPAKVDLDWLEPVHETVFRIFAPARLAGSVSRGTVRIWCGPLIIGEVNVAITVGPGTVRDDPDSWPTASDSAARYRRIFPSYSHRDGAIVTGFREAALALGDEYLQDALALRSGERWNPRLLELIEDADVFQLFWSNNSMRSQYCRQEWEYALGLRRPRFIRPLYWEDPFPSDSQQDLPPPTLRALHFARVHTATAGDDAAPPPVPTGFTVEDGGLWHLGYAGLPPGPARGNLRSRTGGYAVVAAALAVIAIAVGVLFLLHIIG